VVNLHSPKYLTSVDKIEGLSEERIREMRRVTEVYPFRANDYYLGLIDWKDPHDPNKEVIVPILRTRRVGDLDALRSTSSVALERNTSITDTALLLVSKVCGSFCRFCFRKRLFRQTTKRYE
jgi:L-lysine 2,3-aminomutase